MPGARLRAWPGIRPVHRTDAGGVRIDAVGMHRARGWAAQGLSRLLLGEVLFAGTTDWTGPIVRQVLELGPCWDVVIGIAVGGIVNIAANRANPAFH